jgi:aldehyde reductase
MPKSCEASLRRLGIETIDLYLLHWPGSVPIEETVEAFESLQRAGKIRHWGISNFDTEGVKPLAPQVNQVLYNLGERGIEWDLLPLLRQRGIPVMAYSPFDEGRLLHDRALVGFAKKHGMTPAQVAIAWLLAQEGVIAIPKTGDLQRVEENAAALAHPLSAAQLRELDALYPPPDGPTPLAMI